MRQYWWEPPHPPPLVSPNIFWCPPLFPVSPQPPSVSIQADGLPLTEHWHQMCSSSVDSGTSWAECASGSVNENGSAVHLCVCVCVCVCVVYRGSVACDSWGISPWVRVFSRAAASCTAAQLSHAALNSTPTMVETIQLPIQNKHTHSLSLSLYTVSRYVAVCYSLRRAVSHNRPPKTSPHT